MRAQVSIAYLVARAADTIADTKALPSNARFELLLELKAAISDASRVVTAVGVVSGGELKKALAAGIPPIAPPPS